jgi:predicted phosphodiesterase
MWTTTHTHRNVTQINLSYSRTSRWSQRVLITSDRHWDNPKSKQALQKKHLEQALRYNAPVIDAGDFFCMMQGKYDPRKELGDVRPEHNVPEYLDAIVNTADVFFSPYAHIFAVLGQGNHDWNILKRCGTNVVERFAERMRTSGGTVRNGGISGWVQFVFRRKNETKSGTRRFSLHYSHGTGAAGGVSRGTQGAARRAAMLDCADFVVSGHIHENWMIEVPRHGVTAKGVPYIKPSFHMAIPTYKEEFVDGAEGFHNENERPPKPIGAWWLEFTYDRETDGIVGTPIPAK